MFVPLIVPLPPAGAQRLDICFRALRPQLRRKTPGRRPRWRSRLVADEGLRHHRTTLLGHMPGFSGETPVIGPFRPVTLHRPVVGAPFVTEVDLRARLLPDGTGLISVRLKGRDLLNRSGSVGAGAHRGSLTAVGDALKAEVLVPAPALWWPHTHGEPCTYPVDAELDGYRVDLGRVGFRTVERRDAKDGFGLVVNDVPVFSRGAIWSGLDASARPSDPARLRAALEWARDAGFNMLRVVGTAVYETDDFFACCDALGIMVWHDFMFARFDYPDDEAFRHSVDAEAGAFLDRVQAHPSLAVLCGGTEIAQTAAMAGCAPDTWWPPLFEDLLARRATDMRPDVVYLPHSPWCDRAEEGSLPFAASAPVTHYFGVGAYGRPLSELDAAGVRFAAECLAFANLPDGKPGQDAAVPRDHGATWDFADVTDHYIEQLFKVSPSALRRQGGEEAAALGRAAIAIVMQQAIGTWRTDGVCAGALVLMLHDLLPGAGWGVIGSDGRPKTAWHALRAICQPIQVILRDLVHNGLVLHTVNETAHSRRIRLGLRGLTPDGAVESLGEAAFELPARAVRTLPATSLLGRWRDLANAWQFGPPAFVALGATLDDATTGQVLSDAVLFPAGPALTRGHPDLRARLSHDAGGWSVHVSSQRFAQFVEIEDECAMPAVNHFHLWPGESKVVPLRKFGHRDDVPAGSVRALNAFNAVHYGLAA